ncbi:hypothetical protein DFH11DRAFT_1616587 [Phellopilus nigrolimitatus]|nr:hypothetical protein DFH11DRAFT_1616587 [Phellopilus nigrolimitatus]
MADDFERGYKERGDDRHRSSRGHDDREFRGDRYTSSRRGDDRRDREPRDRRERRDYDDRPPRRHHEDDRYRGGRGDDRGGRPPRRDRDDEPSVERRSPTPENALPISQRKRKASGWDVHAPGYEQYTAMQAKQTGLFNLPGANRTQVPPILSIPGLPPPMPVQGLGMGMGMGNNPNLVPPVPITPEINETNLGDFFNSKMKEMNIGTGAAGNPVLAVQCNYEKNYAFVEFRSAEDATAAMAIMAVWTSPLQLAYTVPGVVSTNVPDSINKIFVGGLPTYLNEEQVQELLKSFGELKAFNLVRENGNGPSKSSQGFAFFEYVDPDVTDVACQGLNGMELGDRYLVVQRASIGAKPGQPGIPNIPYDQFPEIPRPILPAGDLSQQTSARILLMLNMVTPDDLTDDQEYADIYEDIKEECSGFGPVDDLRVPRPVKKDKSRWAPGESGQQAALDAQRQDEAAGVGRVYVKFADADAAGRALKSLAGRSFAGRSIIATLLSEDSQTTPPLNLVFAPQPTAPPPLPPSFD